MIKVRWTEDLTQWESLFVLHANRQQVVNLSLPIIWQRLNAKAVFQPGRWNVTSLINETTSVAEAINSNNLDVLITMEIWHQSATDGVQRKWTSPGFLYADMQYIFYLCLLTTCFGGSGLAVFHQALSPSQSSTDLDYCCHIPSSCSSAFLKPLPSITASWSWWAISRSERLSGNWVAAACLVWLVTACQPTNSLTWWLVGSGLCSGWLWTNHNCTGFFIDLCSRPAKLYNTIPVHHSTSHTNHFQRVERGYWIRRHFISTWTTAASATYLLKANSLLQNCLRCKTPPFVPSLINGFCCI